MKKAVHVLFAAATGALVTTAMTLTPSSPTPQGRTTREAVPVGRSTGDELEEGRMVVEWTPGKEAVVRVFAESEESLQRLRIVGPNDLEVIDLDVRGETATCLASVDIEFREPELEKLIESYAEGPYQILAVTVGEKLAFGSAELSFDLPPPPRVVHPFAGQRVQANNLVVSWLTDPGVEAYEVEIEQDDDDEDEGKDDGLRIRLPPEQTSLRVPPGFLKRGHPTSLDVVAIGANGNRTVTEVEFTTRP